MNGTNKLKPAKSNRGFTLIELLVVAAILAILAFAAINLFITTLLGGGKSTALNSVKANGDYALTQMERMIRNATRLEPNLLGIICLDNMDSITLLNPDSQTTTFSQEGSQIASNSAGFLTSSNLVASDLKFDCTRSTSGTPDIVNIEFKLRKGDPAVDRVTDIVEVEFSGSAQLRSY